MTDQPLTAADAALRERITELSVHIPCGGLRGPIQKRSAAYPHLPVKWQSCRDEDSPQRWPGHDVSREYDLCVICFRATAGGSSRWSWLACDNCRAAHKKAMQAGSRPLALGRHSIMNGVAIRGGPNSQEQAARLVRFARGDDRLRAWRDNEYRRLASAFSASEDVPLRDWKSTWPPSAHVSHDAVARLLSGGTPTAADT
ncbi:MAG: hypothetical protein HYZ39_04770 [Mycolicibacterium cosmeticum]|nr:hypothetical protein [Mycolicibacterium cosmeticum]